MLNLYDNIYKPDVLSCLADLSNDEVFTPPEVANKMLDMLPQELFKDPSIKFLDPACKSGIFLREIAKRLIVGLEKEYPDLQERLDHIFHEQLYGIAITEITSLLSRRSLYCSKYPNGKYAVSRFDEVDGNIKFHVVTHQWKNGSCIYCGASEKEYKRADILENHAYEFIHTIKPEEILNMKFDVIISNPPYQLSDGGGEGSSAKPIYQHFIDKAKKLNPRYISMIVPARWYSGGKGLDDFREAMLNDKKISVLHDFQETSDCFPGLNIRGGVCYFLWDSSHEGECEVFNHKGDDVDYTKRYLLYEDTGVFIRNNKAISIVNKVRSMNEETMDSKVSSRLPFGIASNFDNYTLKETATNNVILYRSDRSKNSEKRVYIKPSAITKNIEWKDKKKVLVSKASPGGDEYPHSVITEPIYAEENSVCTETYLIVDFVNDKQEAENLINYMKTKFFRFMMAQIKNTQNISKGVFALVPVQDISKKWTDEELYKKYGITEDEAEFIDTIVKPMDTKGGDE